MAKRDALVADGLADLFLKLKKMRRRRPLEALRLSGELAALALGVLGACERQRIKWRGGGKKDYSVFSGPGAPIPFSKAVNEALFICDPKTFSKGWGALLSALEAASRAKRQTIDGLDVPALNSLVYTAVHSYAAAVDLVKRGDRGTPGSFFEKIVGPVVALLSGREEGGAIKLTPPGRASILVPVDLSFASANGKHVLVIPTKISSRERIVQAYVHQLLLEKLSPGIYHTALCLSNENNIMFPRGTAARDRQPRVAELMDTLVPGTIAAYQEHVATLDGLYYLDPPDAYATGARKGLPPVRTFGDLLARDLPTLLA